MDVRRKGTITMESFWDQRVFLYDLFDDVLDISICISMFYLLHDFVLLLVTFS